jgi:hypothetical protein
MKKPWLIVSYQIDEGPSEVVNNGYSTWDNAMLRAFAMLRATYPAKTTVTIRENARGLEVTARYD